MTCHTIIVSNFEPNATIHYPLIILKGTIKNPDLPTCHKDNIVLRTETSQSDFKLAKNKFKLLIELKSGKNNIELQYCCSSLTFPISYIPSETKYSVLPLYIICQGHNGAFQAPETQTNNAESALKRITLGAKLLQSVIAEKINQEMNERKTFKLQDCTVFHSKLNYQDARKMSQEELWTFFAREIVQSHMVHEFVKFLGFLSCTRYCGEKYRDNFKYEDILKITEAHVALGGGGLALFGTACLHTWPENLIDVAKNFQDPTKIDRKALMDDSCYRGTFGACFSTTLGSVLHELCHSFDLGHTEKGIMGRGFDDIYNVFICHENFKKIGIYDRRKSIVFEEGFSTSNDENVEECEEDKTFWTKSCITLLAYHKWLNNFNPTKKKLIFEPVTRFVSSAAGLRVIEIRKESDGFVMLSWIFTKKILKYSFQLPDDEMAKLSGDFLVIVEDNIGQILKQCLTL